MRIHRLFVGLIGIVLIGGCAEVQRAREPLSGEAAGYRRDVVTLASAKFEGRGAGTAGNELATAWLVERFREIGLRPAFSVPGGEGSYLQAFALADGTVVHNVGGYLPGAGEGEPDSLEASHAEGRIVIVGAHLDHLGYGGRDSFSYVRAIHSGADDNASGVAGLLLLARRYAQRSVQPGARQRAIWFVAFNGEELKMAGSKYFVSHLDELHLRKQNIVAMLNMDMIGRLRDEMLYIFGTDTSDAWPGRITGAMSDVKSTLHVRLLGSPNTMSDQQPFAEAGVPVLQFFTGKHEDYHRITDTAEKIDAGGAVRVMDVVDRIISDF